MPINGLLGAPRFVTSSSLTPAEFLEERGLVRSEQLGALANCRLGVQGDHWFKSLQVRPRPVSLFLGFAPLSLIAC